MKIAIIEPYFIESHANWAQGFAEHSRHDVEIFHLSGAFWKWRMHGGAVTLARRFISADCKPDLLLASDMLDLGAFLALTRRRTAETNAAIYFHENQLSYPWSPQDEDKAEKRDVHYGFVNYLSALAADAVFFNSRYHENSFLTELAALLARFPDHNETSNIAKIEAKSRVLPLGMDLRRFDRFKPTREQLRKPPRILWNHRWEYDKNPEEFFEAMLELDRRGVPFEIAVLGRSFRRKPAIFEKARERLGRRIVRFGFEEDFANYACWLWSSDIIPVTSHQDFFGISVMEAIHCGCFPLLPQRLAYPELLPSEFRDICFYEDFYDLVDRLESSLSSPEKRNAPGLSKIARSYDWKTMASQYDEVLEEAARGLRKDR